MLILVGGSSPVDLLEELEQKNTLMSYTQKHNKNPGGDDGSVV
jgi:hypothetical protein